MYQSGTCGAGACIAAATLTSSRATADGGSYRIVLVHQPLAGPSQVLLLAITRHPAHHTSQCQPSLSLLPSYTRTRACCAGTGVGGWAAGGRRVAHAAAVAGRAAAVRLPARGGAGGGGAGTGASVPVHIHTARTAAHWQHQRCELLLQGDVTMDDLAELGDQLRAITRTQLSRMLQRQRALGQVAKEAEAVWQGLQRAVHAHLTEPLQDRVRGSSCACLRHAITRARDGCARCRSCSPPCVAATTHWTPAQSAASASAPPSLPPAWACRPHWTRCGGSTLRARCVTCQGACVMLAQALW